MKKIKINNISISYPENIEGIALGKAIELYPVYKRLMNKRIEDGWFDNIEFLSYLCNFEGITDQDEKYELASQLSENTINGEFIFDQLNLSKLSDPKQYDGLIPKFIEIDGKKINIPSDLFGIELKLGQLKHFAGITKRVENRHKTSEFSEVLKKLSIGTKPDEFTTKEINLINKYDSLVFDGYFDNINYLAANVIQGITGVWDVGKADEISKKLLELPAIKILPVGFFLLAKLRESLFIRTIISMVELFQIYVARQGMTVKNTSNIQI